MFREILGPWRAQYVDRCGFGMMPGYMLALWTAYRIGGEGVVSSRLPAMMAGMMGDQSMTG